MKNHGTYQQNTYIIFLQILHILYPKNGSLCDFWQKAFTTDSLYLRGTRIWCLQHIYFPNNIEKLKPFPPFRITLKILLTKKLSKSTFHEIISGENCKITLYKTSVNIMIKFLILGKKLSRICTIITVIWCPWNLMQDISI